MPLIIPADCAVNLSGEFQQMAGRQREMLCLLELSPAFFFGKTALVTCITGRQNRLNTGSVVDVPGSGNPALFPAGHFFHFK